MPKSEVIDAGGRHFSDVGDGERVVPSYVAINQIELSETALDRFTGTAQIKGEPYDGQAQVDPGKLVQANDFRKVD